MRDKRIKFLSNIPETEAAVEESERKWVPKKKHEVLKAKYKCLKKLFQIYDAGVIGMLPPVEAEPEEGSLDTTRRKIKRSRRPKTDTAAGTSQIDLTFDPDETYQDFDDEKTDYLDHKSPSSKPTSTIFTQVEDLEPHKSATKISSSFKLQDEYTQDSQTNLLLSQKSTLECESQVILNSKGDYYTGKRRRSKFKFQAFFRRLFGVRPDGKQSNGRSYSTSYCAKRKRGPIRIKGQSRSRNRSESCLRELKTPVMLSCVQTVQKHCLADTTSRRCPIVGCEMTTYGIINYNDHLNISHFPEKKYICHYCHEGFENEEDKVIHENEHIGIMNKRGKKISATKSFLEKVNTSITQTDSQVRNTGISEEKLDKIINFIEKIPDPERFVAEAKNQSYASINSRDADRDYDDYESADDVKSTSQKSNCRKMSSCGDIKGKSYYLNELSTILKRSSKHSNGYQKSNVTCGSIDEQFDNRHRKTTKSTSRSMYTKTHHSPTTTNSSHCTQASNNRPSSMSVKCKKKQNITSNDGAISIKESSRTINSKAVSFEDSCNDLSQESDAEVSYDQSSNIIYYTSLEAPNSTSNKVVKNISKHTGYSWEPGSKIVRV